MKNIAFAFILVALSLTLVSAGEEVQDPGDTERNTFGPRGEITFVKNEENIAAGELLGTWVPALEISIGSVPPGGDPRKSTGFRQSAYTYEFKTDETAQQRIKESYAGVLDTLRKDKHDKDKVPYLERALQAVYLTGKATLSSPNGESMTADFALVNLHGNPKLFYLEEDGDGESQYIMLARDEDGDADVLWIGGDFNNQDMSPFIRKEHAEKLRAGSDDAEGYVKYIDTKRNLISQEIWGEWVLHEEVTAFVAGDDEQPAPDSMTFTVDEEAKARLEKILEAMAEETVAMGGAEHPQAKELLSGLSRVFASGLMKTTTGEKTTETDFAVISLYGEPMLAFQRPEEKLQILRLQFVCDTDGNNDLLFIGTDLPNKPPQGFQRKAR